MADIPVQSNVSDPTALNKPKKKGGRPKGVKNKIPAYIDDPCGLFTIKARLKELKRIATTATSEQARVNAINAVTKLLNDALTKNENFKITTIIFEEVPEITQNTINKTEETKKEALNNTEVVPSQELIKPIVKDAQIVGNCNSVVKTDSSMAELDIDMFIDKTKKIEPEEALDD